MSMTVASGTRSPRFMYAAASLPIAVSSLMCWRSRSPLDRCVSPSFSASSSAWVPLPEPGAPTSRIRTVPPLCPRGTTVPVATLARQQGTRAGPLDQGQPWIRRSRMASNGPLRALLAENIHPNAVDVLESAGVEVESITHAMGEDELVSRLEGTSFLGIRSGTHVSAEALAAATDLRAIGAFCIGTNQ